uniref:Dipeptidase n=1 Tax=Amphora coffeiformis TaxID=265554 RepID=A0A7S3LFR9_9STRA
MMPVSRSSMIIVCAVLLLCLTQACTDILVTPGASHDGAMIAYNADSPTLFGYLYHYPASQNPPGTIRSVYDWDSGVYLGDIPEVAETYNVIGNTNEHGLVIGETTFGGVMEQNTEGKIDYGSLIWITLQRAKTCREAIALMDELVNTYGYYSEGESFSLADHSGEVWILEMIGKGNDFKGAVWVAQRIPDGSVAAHANQARITTFDRDDPDNFMYAADVVDIAVHYGLWDKDADESTFSFSDVYAPLNFLSARQGEARVWSIFSQILGEDFAANYLNYARGTDLTRRMPLYITPPQKLTVKDVSHLLTSHYENTPLDSSVDVGAGIFGSPYRPRPLAWNYNNTLYHNERSVATPKTGWSFVAQIRLGMPAPLSCVTWFASDDSSTAPRVPFYSSSTAVSPAFAGKGAQDGVTEPILQFDLTKAFWVQNMVSNLCYSRWRDIYPVLRRKIDDLQDQFAHQIAISDQRALQLYNDKGVEAAVKYLTLVSVNAGNKLHSAWMEFYGQLFVTYRDFYTIVPKPEEPSCGCDAIEPGLSPETQRRIVQETADHYKVQDDSKDHPDLLRTTATIM